MVNYLIIIQKLRAFTTTVRCFPAAARCLYLFVFVFVFVFVFICYLTYIYFNNDVFFKKTRK